MMDIMNKLSIKKRAQILSCLIEGNSLRDTSRMSDVAFNTVLKFIGDIGQVCAEYQDKRMYPKLKTIVNGAENI